MALAVWQSTIVNRSGDVQPNAQVEVRLESSGALAAIYADRDGTTPLSNPFNADENGFARFYAAGGAYKITASLGSFSQTFRHVAIGLLGEQDQFSGGTISGNVAINGALTIDAGGGALSLKPGLADHVYMRLYADTENPDTRSAYFGFGDAGTTRLDLINEMAGGDIQVGTSNQIRFNAPSTVVSGTLTINAGGPALSLKPGSQDRTFIEFYADTQNPNNRSAYFGFAFAGTSSIDLVNEMAGDIYFQTGGRILFQAPTIAVQGRGGVLHHGDTALTSGRVFVRQGGSPVGFLEGDITIIW